MRLSRLGIAWAASLALVGCAHPAFGFGKARKCGGEPPALERCEIVSGVGLMVCLAPDGETVTRMELLSPALNGQVCHPPAHYERLWKWCMGTPE